MHCKTPVESQPLCPTTHPPGRCTAASNGGGDKSLAKEEAETEEGEGCPGPCEVEFQRGFGGWQIDSQGFQGTLQGLTGACRNLQGVEYLFKISHTKKTYGTQAETEVGLLTSGPYLTSGGYMRRKKS